MATIDILLATYNGARFLSQQLASLAAQSFTDWRLIVRDDGSSDGSLDLVRHWAEAGGHPLVVIEDGRRNLGAKGNFAALLEASDAPWFACCDQDDVWLPEKLALMLAQGQAAEARAGAGTPVLAYSDLQVVGPALEPIAPSFRHYASLHPPRAGREVIDLMTQNVVTGCASLGNAALRKAALPIPADAIMHDWWLALVAAATGTLVEVPEATLLYRQHGGNAIGAVRWTPLVLARSVLLDFAETRVRVRELLSSTRRQARALHRRYAGKLSATTAATVRAYAWLGDRLLRDRLPFCLTQAYKLRRAVRISVAMIGFWPKDGQDLD